MSPPPSLDDIKTKLLPQLSKKPIPTMRVGDTGIGKTLETILGVEENNLSSPDLIDDETDLKSKRAKSKSLITLFTLDKKCWKIRQLDAIDKYGQPNVDGRLALYSTVNTKSNGIGLFLFITDKEVSVKHIDGDLVGQWTFDALESSFTKKLSKIVLAKADVDYKNDIEHFRYNKATVFSGDDFPLKKLFEEGKLVIDLRLHEKFSKRGKRGVRNHGTGIRIFEKDLPHLYSNIEEVPL